MPMLIDYIDRIARIKNRDVLILSFFPESGSKTADPFFDHEESKPRKKVMAWLDENNIPYCPCAGVADTSTMGAYNGNLYLDVPFDVDNPDYMKLTGFLENTDETTKIEGVNFGYFPLKKAKKNAYMDEPGYWERQASDW